MSFGIQGFVGLPGLTMELIVAYEEAKIQYVAIDIDFNPEEGIVIEKPRGEQHMSEQDYIELIKKLNANRNI